MHTWQNQPRLTRVQPHQHAGLRRRSSGASSQVATRGCRPGERERREWDEYLRILCTLSVDRWSALSRPNVSSQRALCSRASSQSFGVAPKNTNSPSTSSVRTATDEGTPLGHVPAGNSWVHSAIWTTRSLSRRASQENRRSTFCSLWICI